MPAAQANAVPIHHGGQHDAGHPAMMRLTAAIERKHQAAELRAQAVELIRRADALDHLTAGQIDEATCMLHESTKAPSPPLVQLAASLSRSRRLRQNYLPTDIFGEPGWDILLDLYTLDQDGRGVSVTNASLAGDTPPTTGLRWLKFLEQKGLVAREHSHRDRRVTWVRLTSAAQDRMRNYLVGGNCSERC